MFPLIGLLTLDLLKQFSLAAVTVCLKNTFLSCKKSQSQMKSGDNDYMLIVTSLSVDLKSVVSLIHLHYAQ